ncbi:MAG: nitroreductase family protein [Acidocella sp.]|nr:nitroreductase family protein [Acidocella sp.]
MTTANARTAEHPIDKMFLERWSPRAFTGEEISEGTLRTLFEAARWAPSSYNSQPWRFLYARRDNAHWDKFLNLLIPFNQSWAKTASALVFVISEETMAVPGKEGRVPSHSHSFDAGAAWAYLALQASLMGWQAHGMGGIDYDRVYTELKIPAGFRVEAGVAIGKQGPKTLLPEALQAREVPSGRNPVQSFVYEGGF